MAARRDRRAAMTCSNAEEGYAFKEEQCTFEEERHTFKKERHKTTQGDVHRD